MNIAFFTDRECCPTFGGTERTTALMAKHLKILYGYGIFSIFNNPALNCDSKYIFDGSFQWVNTDEGVSLLSDFIKKNDISIIINQGDFYFCQSLHNILKIQKLKCKQIFAFHFMPGSGEEALISLKETYKLWKHNPLSKELLKVIGYPIYYRFATNRFRNNYRLVDKLSDKIVLLSDSFKIIWNNYAYPDKISSYTNDFVIIPNALSFDHFSNIDEIQKKEHRILIVSRLDERQKKLSKALDIWNSISHDSLMKDWNLDIVGDGPDMIFYQNYIKKNHIDRVSLYGRQNPVLYYKRSSIFMMTSDYEGFGMTLIEASQFGVAPFAFDTYPALKEIITDNVNGFVIKENDYKTYETKLLEIASDDDRRIQIALNAIDNSKRFKPESIAEKWHNLINNVIHGNTEN